MEAWIHNSAKVGKGVTFGRYSLVDEEVIIRDNTSISDYVKIPEGSTIGADCIIGSYVRLGKHCIIESGVSIKCHAIISPDVIVGKDSFIGPNAILLHATPTGEHKPCKIGKNVFISAGVYVNPGVEIGDNIVVGAGSVVTKSIHVPGVYIGTPARLRSTKIRE